MTSSKRSGGSKPAQPQNSPSQAAPSADATDATAAGEKLQKVLARAGLGSRRALEAEIEAGKVKVNGQVAKLGDRVTGSDKIIFAGKPVKLAPVEEQPVQVLLYNKKEGEVSTQSDPEGRPTVFESLPRLKGERWIQVGRLDINTSGLLLFTTDGELAHRLMHPSSEVDREYLVRVLGDVDEAMIQRLKEGIMLDDGPAQFTDVQPAKNEGANEGANKWFYVVLMEGRNREVRRLWESQGIKVNRLKRVRFGPVFLPSRLRSGRWEVLEQKDVSVIYESVGLPARVVKTMSRSQEEKVKRQKRRSRPRTSNR